MTLLDIDKSSDDRGSPTPNVHDVLSAESVAAKATQGNQYSVNAPPSGRINVTNQRIITNDGTSNRLLITPTQVLLSQAGVDVTQATPSQLLFNSGQDIFKIVQSGTTSLTPPSSWSGNTVITATIAHGLGAAPAFIAFVNNPTIPTILTYTGGLTNLPSVMWISAAGGSSGLFLSAARSDASNLYIDLVNLSSSAQSGLNIYTWTYKFYILQETAT